MWAELERALASGTAVIGARRDRGLGGVARDRSSPTASRWSWWSRPTTRRRGALEADIRFFLGRRARSGRGLDEIASLPGIDVSPYAELSPDRACIVERVATLYRLTQPALRPRIVVTSAEALARRTVAPAELAARGRTIRKGEHDRSRRGRGAAGRRRLDADAGRRRARDVRGARRRDRRLRAARAAPGADRAVRRRGRVAALVRGRVAAHAAAGRAGCTCIRCARRSPPARATCARGCASTPTRSRSRPRRRGG